MFEQQLMRRGSDHCHLIDEQANMRGLTPRWLKKVRRSFGSILPALQPWPSSLYLIEDFLKGLYSYYTLTGRFSLCTPLLHEMCASGLYRHP